MAWLVTRAKSKTTCFGGSLAGRAFHAHRDTKTAATAVATNPRYTLFDSEKEKKRKEQAEFSLSA